ncbi:MAG: entry exclusion lipoprotein TrbK [Alphaproteobacteria bacterium 41-28]|nr:MAG: entry exclusion lipoprotein TrbK [Alphaproteobacteria bacterium 41-28]
MKANKTLILTATVLTAPLAVLMTGCDNTSEKQAEEQAEEQIIPEVNEENCKPKNIDKIKNKEMQQEFSNRCFLRNNFKPSPKREW